MKNTIEISLAEYDLLRKIAVEANDVTIKTPETIQLRSYLCEARFMLPDVFPPSNVVHFPFNQPLLFELPDQEA